MMLSKGLSCTFDGPTGSPLSVTGILDVAGCHLDASSCQSPAPGRSESSCHLVEDALPERATPFYSRGHDAYNVAKEQCWSKDTEGREEGSTLSELMLQRNWSEARQRLASEAHEHEIYTRLSIPYSSGDISYAFPLHLACALRPLPPASFVRFLIKLYPDGTRVEEEMWGLLPIHFAANMFHKEEDLMEDYDIIVLDDETTLPGSASEAMERTAFNQRCIITALVKAYPESLLRKERFSGMLPIHIAAATAPSRYDSLTSNDVVTLEMLIQKCPPSLAIMDDWGETPTDIAWRTATFSCLRCRVRGRYIALDHGRCPHVALPNKGKACNPLLRRDFDCHYGLYNYKQYAGGSKKLTSDAGDTETTGMSDESQRLSSRDSEMSRDDVFSATSDEVSTDNVKDTVIRLSTQNDWSVSMQIRLESLHSGRGKRWSKKLRHKPPNPFFEVSVLQDDSSIVGETIYRSYPLIKTKNATWEKIKSLDVKLPACCPKIFRFRITVFDCDLKGGNHVLIGESEVLSVDLARQTARLIPIQRNNKVKGFLRFVHFQLDSA